MLRKQSGVRAAALAFLFSVGAFARGAATYDNTESVTKIDLPVTLVFTVASGATLGLAGLAVTEDASSLVFTWNGTTMTLVSASERTVAESHVYKIASPASGSVTVICSGTVGALRNKILWAMSFTGSNTTPENSWKADGVSTGPTVGVTTTTNSPILVDAVATFGTIGTLAVNCSQTLRWLEPAGAGQDGGAGSTKAVGAAPVTTSMCYTQVTSPNWAIVALEVGPTLVTLPPTGTMMLLGTGK